MNKDLKRAIEDYFDPADLVDFLNLRIEEITDAFEDVLLENEEEIKEYINYNNNDDDDNDD